MAVAAEAGVAQGLEKPPGSAGGPAVNPAAEVEAQSDERWKRVLDLRCELSVDLPMPNFQIADLLRLRKGCVINAHWRVGQDVPLHLNATLIGWIEFELVTGHLAVRLTELA